jgi:hypothetical protein
VDQLGPNALGELLEPGRTNNCYLDLLLPPGPAGEPEAGTVLIVGPATLLHPAVPQPAGSLIYALLTGHPERAPGELVFLADLTVELRAWPTDTWAKVRIDPQAAAHAVIDGWKRGDLLGLRLGGLTAEEALALERPAMTYVRASSATGSAASSPRRTGGGGTRPAAAGQATASCSSGCLDCRSVGSLPRGVRGGHRPSGHPGRIQVPLGRSDTAGGGGRPLPQPAGGPARTLDRRRPVALPCHGRGSVRGGQCRPEGPDAPAGSGSMAGQRSSLRPLPRPPTGTAER